MLLAIPDALGVLRLILVDLLCEIAVVTEEVRQFTDGINFSLEDRLALAQHRRGIQLGAIGTREQLSSLQEDRGTVFPVNVRPLRLGFHRGTGCQFQLLLAGNIKFAKDVLMIMRHPDVLHIRRAVLFSANHDRNINHNRSLPLQLRLDLCTLRRIGSII
jgi:hypothetical protein